MASHMRPSGVASTSAPAVPDPQAGAQGLVEHEVRRSSLASRACEKAALRRRIPKSAGVRPDPVPLRRRSRAPRAVAMVHASRAARSASVRTSASASSGTASSRALRRARCSAIRAWVSMLCFDLGKPACAVATQCRDRLRLRGVRASLKACATSRAASCSAPSITVPHSVLDLALDVGDQRRGLRFGKRRRVGHVSMPRARHEFSGEIGRCGAAVNVGNNGQHRRLGDQRGGEFGGGNGARKFCSDEDERRTLRVLRPRPLRPCGGPAGRGSMPAGASPQPSVRRR